ncbi:hypothetical protein DXV75_09325 [Alteromonas aestuariivivens]|uniref:Uncharacterized protein n=1 Tax=Alteromonas aestuariivivens TaxID=1938339 RepID=A0A3D8M8F7_9ALTE|nr:hypothetical protein DXV75_09325 [Alteromonas aestuariivivens]
MNRQQVPQLLAIKLPGRALQLKLKFLFQKEEKANYGLTRGEMCSTFNNAGGRAGVPADTIDVFDSGTYKL